METGIWDTFLQSKVWRRTSPWAGTVVMKACADPRKRLANGALVKLGGPITHQVDICQKPWETRTKSHLFLEEKLFPRRCAAMKAERKPRWCPPPPPLLTSTATTMFATWIVSTMYEAGKSAQIAAEMTACNLSILANCETRWIESGCIPLSTGQTVLYSGYDDANAPIHRELDSCWLHKTPSQSKVGSQCHPGITQQGSTPRSEKQPLLIATC